MNNETDFTLGLESQYSAVLYILITTSRLFLLEGKLLLSYTHAIMVPRI